MKVLFVSSGNSSKFEIAPFIKAQGEDLRELGLEVDFFPIKGKGIRGYLKNIKPLRKKIKKGNYDIIHAHFVLSAWVALLTFTGRKIVASFMGSDTYGDVDLQGKRIKSSYINIILAKLIQPFVSKIIVKSKNLEDYIYQKSKCIILPNGVNLEKFKIYKRDEVRTELGLNLNKKYILFLGDKSNPRKNFKLLKDAYDLIRKENESIELLTPFPVTHEMVVKYMNAADVLAFTSFLEGSPNVVKEAMACNLPVVTVDVGDTRWLVEKSTIDVISTKQPTQFADDLLSVLRINCRSEGRNILIKLGLESKFASNKLIEIYKSI